ncbi:unnamed protein product [Moneuplotes crassus]|uniref:Transmembrane protein n=1 Tax=Euplotes crassus TaxID=5936 RepID=A0AAD2D2A0_EUPCR|nr:unnamed protein product [Moneuplotes crassus]
MNVNHPEPQQYPQATQNPVNYPQPPQNYPQNQAIYPQNPQMQPYQHQNPYQGFEQMAQKIKSLSIIYFIFLAIALGGTLFQFIMGCSRFYLGIFWWFYIIVSIGDSCFGLAHVFLNNLSAMANIVFMIIHLKFVLFHVAVFFYLLFDVIVDLKYVYGSDRPLIVIFWLCIIVQVFPKLCLVSISVIRRKIQLRQQRQQVNQGIYAPLNQNPQAYGQNPQAYAQNPHGQAPVPGYQQIPSTAMPREAPNGNNPNGQASPTQDS